MKLLNYFLILTLSFLIYNCDSTDPKPPDTKPPGYQEDIAWPSLADSPWPIAEYNAQGNARIDKDIDNKSSFSFINDLPLSDGGIVFDTDSTFLFVSAINRGHLYKINIHGEYIWDLDIGYPAMLTDTPLLLSNGNIVVFGAARDSIYCFSNTGNLMWRAGINNKIRQTTVVVDKNGNLYVADYENTLYSISPDGKILFSYTNPSIYGNAVTQITFSPDGKNLYVAGLDKTLISFNIQMKDIDWTFGDKKLLHTPVVDSEGFIYVIPYISQTDSLELYKISESGNVEFSYSFQSKEIIAYNPPTVDFNGNVIFSTEDTLYSVDREGKLNWAKNIEHGRPSRIVIDRTNNIHFFNSPYDKLNYYKFSEQGENLVTLEAENIPGFLGSVGFNNKTLFIPIHFDKKIVYLN